jgi:arginyl-tRNA synthetase
VSKNTAIKELIYSYLLNGLNFYLSQRDKNHIINSKIPVHQGRDINRVLYISGVALQLAKSHNSGSGEIASAIASHISNNCAEALLIGIVPPGWIHIELTHGFLAAWLQSIAVGESNSSLNFLGIKSSLPDKWQSVKSYNPSRLFKIQYAHARCYSLILLAGREGLIKLKEPLSASHESWHLGSLVATETLPWLNSDDRQLRLHHPAEKHLIMELVKAVDELECAGDEGKVNWEKIAWDLSQAFENFWSQCRIWGEVKTNSPELAQARLGLIMATQCVLRVLLKVKLGVTAPVEL